MEKAYGPNHGRVTQGTLVGHHDQVPFSVSPREASFEEGAVQEVKFAKKVTGSKEGAGLPWPRGIELRRLYVLAADSEAHGDTGGCLGCTALALTGTASRAPSDECRER